MTVSDQMECIVAECISKANGKEAGGKLMCAIHSRSRDASVYWTHRPCLACLSVDHSIGECFLVPGPHTLVHCEQRCKFPTPDFKTKFGIHMDLLLDNTHNVAIETHVSFHEKLIIVWCCFPPSHQPQELLLQLENTDYTISKIRGVRVEQTQETWWACNIYPEYTYGFEQDDLVYLLVDIPNTRWVKGDEGKVFRTVEEGGRVTVTFSKDSISEKKCVGNSEIQHVTKPNRNPTHKIQTAKWIPSYPKDKNYLSNANFNKDIDAKKFNVGKDTSNLPPDGAFPERFRENITNENIHRNMHEKNMNEKDMAYKGSMACAQRILSGMRSTPSFVYEALISTAVKRSKCVCCDWVHFTLSTPFPRMEKDGFKCDECKQNANGNSKHTFLAIKCDSKMRCSNRVAVVFSLYHAMTTNPIHYETTRSCLQQMAESAANLYTMCFTKHKLHITGYQSFTVHNMTQSLQCVRLLVKNTDHKDMKLSVYSVFALVEWTLFLSKYTEDKISKIPNPHNEDVISWPIDPRSIHIKKLVEHMLKHHNNLAVALMTVMCLHGDKDLKNISVLVPTGKPGDTSKKEKQNPMLLHTPDNPGTNRAIRMHANIFTKRDEDILFECICQPNAKISKSPQYVKCLTQPPKTQREDEIYSTPMNRFTVAVHNKYPRLFDLLGPKLKGTLSYARSIWSARRGRNPEDSNVLQYPSEAPVSRLKCDTEHTLPPDVIFDRDECALFGFTNVTVSTNDVITLSNDAGETNHDSVYWVPTETPTLDTRTYQHTNPIFLILATHSTLTHDLFEMCAKMCEQHKGLLVYGSLDVTKKIFDMFCQKLSNVLYTHDHLKNGSTPLNTIVYQTEFDPQRMQKLCQKYECEKTPSLIILDTKGLKSTPSFGVRTITTDGMLRCNFEPTDAYLSRFLAAVPIHAFEDYHKPRNEPRWVDIQTGTHIMNNIIVPTNPFIWTHYDLFNDSHIWEPLGLFS